MPPGSQRASAPVQSSDSSSEDEDDEDSTIDPEVNLSSKLLQYDSVIQVLYTELFTEWELLIFMTIMCVLGA